MEKESGGRGFYRFHLELFPRSKTHNLCTMLTVASTQQKRNYILQYNLASRTAQLRVVAQNPQSRECQASLFLRAD